MATIRFSQVVIPAKAGIHERIFLQQRCLDSRLRALLSGINDEEQKEGVVQTGETGLATLRRLNCVIPREVAESIRRILIHRRMDSATTLRSAQNDNLFRTAVRLRGNDEIMGLCA